MSQSLQIAVAQMNPTVGDFVGNERAIMDALARAAAAGATLVVFPELAICGYPPRDLLQRDDFLAENARTVERLAMRCAEDYPKLTVIVGYVRDRFATHPSSGKRAANAAAVLREGKLILSIDKTLLPTYDVFDERRYFEPGEINQPLNCNGWRIAISICEDLWSAAGGRTQAAELLEVPLYGRDMLKEFAANNVDLVLNLAASPYWHGKPTLRRRYFSEQAKHYRTPLIVANQVGANDDLIFDGSSLVLDGDGTVIGEALAFAPDLMIVEAKRGADGGTALIMADKRIEEKSSTKGRAEQELLAALTLGVRDYFSKSGFKQALIGVSGGIDSALVAALAVQALGSEKVVGIMMPSQFTSEQSIRDARTLAANLGIRLEQVAITPIFAAVTTQLKPLFADLTWDATEENIQARIRGLILMAYANKFGHLLLSTGNKSELAVGYCTLYGDLTGGLAVISDLFKGKVYALAQYLNEVTGNPIPASILSREPSAELRANQRDQDDLPPYELLDRVLEAYIEGGKSRETIIAEVGNQAVVRRITAMVDNNEFKRRQAPLGLKVSRRAFGPGWRLPIARR